MSQAFDADRRRRVYLGFTQSWTMIEGGCARSPHVIVCEFILALDMAN
jgi:hypothetical protein